MPAPASSVRLVCFDLGGVLVRIARDWGDACRRAEVEVPDLSNVWPRHHELMLRYETGTIDEAGYKAALPQCVPQVSPDAIIRIFDAWLLGLYEGAEELLDQLHAAGYITGCLSNTNERHFNTLTRHPQYGPLRDLDYHFVSFRIGAMKPHPDIYRHVEQETGFRGGQILFFDDKPENVEAARAIGWRAEQKTQSRRSEAFWDSTAWNCKPWV